MLAAGPVQPDGGAREHVAAEHFFVCQGWAGLETHGDGKDAFTTGGLNGRPPGLNGKGL